jgi:glutathione peroxidase
MERDKIYGIEFKKNDGTPFSLAGMEDKTLLIVNTASKCGFTPQYKGLEALNKKYAAKGLVVLGFPCDQFAHQEPGSDEEIRQFCEINYGVSFPLMAKIEVNGPGAHPLFVELRTRAGGFLGDAIKWNFTKFLVSPGAKTVKRFAPTVEPEKLESDIEEVLRS